MTQKNNLILDELRMLMDRGDTEQLRKMVNFLHPAAVARLGNEMKVKELRLLLEVLEPRARAQVFSISVLNCSRPLLA